MPMNCAQVETTRRENARLVPVEPHVKSSKTRELFNAGAGTPARIGKSADPTCYDAPVNSKQERTMPRIGDVRFILEMIDADRYEALARKRGWDGGDGMLDYAEHFEAATYSEHKTLEAATEAARTWLAKGKSVFGCCIIDRQVFERFEDDMYPEWERHEHYEVAMDGERIEVDARASH